MIKILKIREYMDKQGKPQGYRYPIDSAKEAATIVEMFADIPKLLENVPKNELYNLHYSLANWGDAKGNEFLAQDILPFDIDGIEVERIDEYVPIVCEVLRVDPAKVGIVYSGNGLHIIVATSRQITDPDYFKETKVHYTAICQDIDYALQEAGLIAQTDNQIWRLKASLRLPFTENRKKDKGIKKCTLINGILELYDYDITKMSKLPSVQPEEQVHKMVSNKMATDTPAVLTCPFLMDCRVNAETLSEPSWYAAVSVVARLENGPALVHQMSSAHPMYSEVETDLKIEQSLELSGARTCGNISTLWDGCKECPHYGLVNSPISLKSKEFIGTKDDGFYNVKYVDGIKKKTTPNYDDLLKYYKAKNTYVNVKDNLYIWHTNHWIEEDNIVLDIFAENNFEPKPVTKMCREFKDKVFRQEGHLKKGEFFETNGLVNFSNGVFDTATETMRLATPEDGFTYTLPFAYDAEAQAPVFEKFLTDVMGGDMASVTLLKEFFGYIVSAAPPTVDPKALIMIGDGANGKSVIIDMLMYIVGDNNCSATSLYDAIRKPEARVNMKGKLLNVTEEVPTATLADSSVFKNLVTGGVLESRNLYKDSVFMKNTAKLVMTCNNLPPTTDFSRGMRRRLLIVEFLKEFTTKLGNKDTEMLSKLKLEAAGIWNVCYQAYKTVIANTEFSVPDNVEARIEEYVTAGSPPLVWFNQGIGYSWMLTESPDDTVSVQEFYQRFRYAAELEGIPINKIPTLRGFWRDLRRKYKFAEAKVVRVGGINSRVVEGIKLIDEQEQGGAF